MKYSIREARNTYPRELLRHGEYHSLANNAEIEFWARIQELESLVSRLGAENAKMLDKIQGFRP